MQSTVDLPPIPTSWNHHHLLGLESLTKDELTLILDMAEAFCMPRPRGANTNSISCAAETMANLFFENSTRTRNSFSLAAKRLGADTVEFSPGTSSTAKGESFIDTAKTIEAMGGCRRRSTRDRRHASPLARHLACSVLNAGDGPHEHPTQGLLDILTIRQQRGSLEGLTVALVGDIAHSRTARSNIWGLKKLGAHVILCGPTTLVSRQWNPSESRWRIIWMRSFLVATC